MSREKLSWHIDKGSPYTSTPLVYDGILYVLMDNGVLSAYDAATSAGGRVYLANEDGDLFVIRAGKTFQADAMNSFNETIFATPALDGNLLIVRTRGHLIALGAV